MSDALPKLKNRADLMHRIYLRFPKSHWLKRWFVAEVNVLQHEGVGNEHTSTDNPTLLLANAYRLRREGQVTPITVH